jgi:hypothetical protein
MDYKLEDVTNIELDMKYISQTHIKLFIDKTLVEMIKVNRIEAYDLYSQVCNGWMKLKKEKHDSSTLSRESSELSVIPDGSGSEETHSAVSFRLLG